MSALLEVTDLRTAFRTDDGVVTAVDGVTFAVERGATLGVVGESGCGKSVTFLSIMGLNDRRTATSTGSAVFDGVDLLRAGDETIRALRGRRIAMIFQDPMTSLNPVKRVGWQLEEAVLVHQDVSHDEARARAIEVLEAVRIPRAAQRVDDYPHQFSGGMRQRVMIAMALVNEPELLIADEPTTALDVTTQAQIIDLMKRLQTERGMAIVIITHDLGIVAEMAGDVLVMYGGQVVEQGPVDDLFYRPQHPYTLGLLGSLPRLDRELERLAQIPGQPPSLLRPPPGCRFAPRCTEAFDRCLAEAPALRPAAGSGHLHRCLLDDAARERHAAEMLGALGGGTA